MKAKRCSKAMLFPNIWGKKNLNSMLFIAWSCQPLLDSGFSLKLHVFDICSDSKKSLIFDKVCSVRA